jgi:hypothetical protein
LQKPILLVLAALATNGLACSSKDEATEPAAGNSIGELVFDTGTYSVPKSTEMYRCFTKTFDEDMWIDHFAYDAEPTVHHMVLAQTLAPEPDGTFECPVFFKPTWIPLFANGTGGAELSVPSGSSFPLPKGTQVLVQLHLLNASEADATGELKIHLRKVARTADESGIFAFGTTDVTLPPKQSTSIHNDCTIDGDVDVFALFPHMHKLGKSLKFEVGPDADHLETIFSVDQWNFDKQFIAAKPVKLHAGDFTRTTCTYDNTTDKEVVFGESTFNEMCFLPTFRTGFTALDGCLELGSWGNQTPGGDASVDVPPSPDAGECSAVTGNDKGIGALCTKGGHECGPGLACTMDLDGTATQGFCMKLGCAATSDCGAGATCCAPKEGGGLIKTCLPEACRPNDCNPVP